MEIDEEIPRGKGAKTILPGCRSRLAQDLPPTATRIASALSPCLAWLQSLDYGPDFCDSFLFRGEWDAERNRFIISVFTFAEDAPRPFHCLRNMLHRAAVLLCLLALTVPAAGFHVQHAILSRSMPRAVISSRTQLTSSPLMLAGENLQQPRLLPSHAKSPVLTVARSSSSDGAAPLATEKKAIDFQLIIYFGLWWDYGHICPALEWHTPPRDFGPHLS